jgi:hypothetical protein
MFHQGSLYFQADTLRRSGGIDAIEYGFMRSALVARPKACRLGEACQFLPFQQFMDRAFGVVNGEMRIRVPTGIGIRDGDAPSGLAGTPKRLLVILAIEQRVRHVTIAMGPTIDGDRQNVSHALENPPWPSMRSSSSRIFTSKSENVISKSLVRPARNCARASRPELGAPGTCTMCSTIASAGSREFR